MTSFKAEYKKEYKRQKNLKLNKIVNKLKAATPKDTGEASEGWAIEKKGIVNPVEHIVALNSGSSVQAGSHFIEKAVLSEPGVKPSGLIVKNK